MHRSHSHPAVCGRCGRTPQAAPGDWNVVYRRGVRTGYLCPDCQTGPEHVEAAVNEAMVDYGGVRSLRPGDPGYERAVAESMVEIINDVWVEFLREAVAAGEPVTLDPYQLADEALRRLRPLALPAHPRGERERLAETYRTLAADGLGQL